MKKHIACIALSLAAAAPAMAQDTAQASASLTQFSYALVDLAPGDGIAPSITFGQHLTLVQAYVWQTQDGALTTLLDGGDLNVDGTLTASAQSGATFATVWHDEATTWAEAGLGVSANGYGNFGTYYTLSPHTQLTFTWLGEVETDTGPANRGIADVYIRATLSQSIDGNYVETSDSLRSSAGLGDAAQWLSLSVSTGANEGRGFYSGVAWSQSVALVPEPEQWAMWLAGLGLAGAAGWRRRKGQPSVKA